MTLKRRVVSGIIGRKKGMTSIFDESGKNIPCTVIEVKPNIVTQVKTMDSDGYEAVQIGTEEKKSKHTTNALQGHFTKAGTAPKKIVREFQFDEELSLGTIIEWGEMFNEGEKVNVVGTSKGKGFQGVVKRHGFHGVGDATHGQHNRMRAPGSIGAASDPSRVFKGMKMAGRTGGDRVKIKNLEVVKMFPEKELILIKGAVPGRKGSIVYIEK